MKRKIMDGQSEKVQKSFATHSDTFSALSALTRGPDRQRSLARRTSSLSMRASSRSPRGSPVCFVLALYGQHLYFSVYIVKGSQSEREISQDINHKLLKGRMGAEMSIVLTD